MSNRDIVRAWKDEEFRNGLSEAQRARLPQNPAGAIELPDEELEDAAGGVTEAFLSLGCSPCIGITSYTCFPNFDAACGAGSGNTSPLTSCPESMC